MKKVNLRSLALGCVLLSTLSAHADTDTWTSGDDGISYSDPGNWSTGVPSSGTIIEIAVQPNNPSVPNTIGVDTGGTTSVAGVLFDNTLTGNVTITLQNSETLTVTGNIANNSGHADNFTLPVTESASTATYTGGAGLGFQQLIVGTTNITTTGAVSVSQTLVFTINSSTTFGKLTGGISASGATITINGTYTGTIGNTFTLDSGGFAGATIGELPTLTTGVWDSSQLLSNGILTVVAGPANQTLVNGTGTINIITGASTTFTGTLTNTGTAGSASLNINLSGSSNVGTVSNLTPASGTVTATGSATVTGTFTAGAVGSGTYTYSNSDPTATTSTATTSGAVNIYNHANTGLAVTGSTTVNAITGTAITSTLTVTNAGAHNVSTTITGTSTGITGITGTVVANGTITGSGTFTAGAAGSTTTHTYSVGSQEDQTVIGATTGTTTTTATVTETSFNHANGVLSVTGSTTLGAIAGTAITSTLTFTNSGANNVSTTVEGTTGSITGISGTVAANGSVSGTGTFTVGAAGSTTTHTYTVGSQEDQTVLGATTGTSTATATVTVTSYTHANGVLTTATGTTVRAVAGYTGSVSLIFSNSGATNDNLIAGASSSNLIGATGTLTAGQAQTLTGTLVIGAVGSSTPNSFSQSWTEDQSILGATAGTQTSSVTISAVVFNHATGTLVVTSGTTIRAIAGTVATSTLTLTNGGANNDNLIAGSATGGLTAATGSLTANQSATLTGTLTVGAAGSTTTHTYSQNFSEDQTVLGATTGTQTASATVTVDSFSHANGVLAITGSTTINAIVGTSVSSALTFTNSGATNDNLTAGAASGGLTAATGTLVANASQALTGTFTVGAAGTGTHVYSQTWTEDQTVSGATAGLQTSTATVTVDAFTHALGLLSVTSGTTIEAIGGATIDSTVTFTNSGATNDSLTAGTATGGLVAATGTLTANQSASLTGTFVTGAIGSTTTHVYGQNYTEDQTVLGATTGTQVATATVTVTNVGHSAPTLSVTSVNVGLIHEGATGSATGTTVLSNGTGPIAGLQIVSLDGLNHTGTGTLIAAGGSQTLSASFTSGTLGALNTTYTIQTEDDQSVVGATTNANLTFTVTGQVYSGQGVWNTNGGGAWGTLAGTGTNTFGANWGTNQGSPGLDPNFVNTDTATFDNTALTAGSSATVLLNGANPSLKSITFNTTGGGYTLAQGSSGSITLNNGSSAAAVTDAAGNQTISAPILLNSNAALSATTAGTTLTISGAISGANMGVGISGAGTVILSGANTYTGTTAVSAGTLQLGATNELANSAVVDLTGGVLDVNGFNQTFQSLTATGGVVTNSSATTTTITFSEPADPVNASNITGNTAVVQAGPGTEDLTGNNTFTGGLSITGGILGAGSATALGATTVSNTGGTLEAYGGIHTIAVGTSYTQGAGGTLMLVLNAVPDAVTGLAATNDILSAGTTISLGGRVVMDFTFIPVKGQAYAIAQANTAAPATPDGITADSANVATQLLTPAGNLLTAIGTLSPDGNTLFETVNSVQLNLGNVPGLTPNETAIANYVSSNLLSGPVFTALVNETVDPAAIAGTLDELSPEKFANFSHSNTFNNAVFATQELDSYFEGQRSENGDFMAGNGQLDSSGLTTMDANIDPGLASTHSRLLAWSPAPLSHGLLNDSLAPVLGGVDMKQTTTSSEVGDPFNAFVVGNAVLAQGFSQPDLAHSDVTTGAVQLGADYRITPHLRAGATFGYGHSDASLDNIGSKATVDSYSPGAYASFADGGWYVNALGSYGFDSFTEDRHFSAISGIAHGAPSGHQIVGNLDGGYDFHYKALTFGPTLGVQYTHLTVDSYTEDGSSGANLAVNRDETDSLRSRLGGHVSYSFQSMGVKLTPHLDASWQHEFLDQSEGITSQFVSVGAGSFSVSTPHPSRDSALLDGGISADLNGTVSVFGDYTVQAGQSNYFGQSVQAGVKVGF